MASFIHDAFIHQPRGLDLRCSEALLSLTFLALQFFQLQDVGSASLGRSDDSVLDVIKQIAPRTGVRIQQSK